MFVPKMPLNTNQQNQPTTYPSEVRSVGLIFQRLLQFSLGPRRFS